MKLKIKIDSKRERWKDATLYHSCSNFEIGSADIKVLNSTCYLWGGKLLLFELLAILSTSGRVAMYSLKVPVISKKEKTFSQLFLNCSEIVMGKLYTEMSLIFILKFLTREKYRSSIHLIYINNDVNSTSVALYKTIYMYPRSLGNVDDITGNILFILCSLPRLIEFHRRFDSDLIRPRNQEDARWLMVSLKVFWIILDWIQKR